MEVATFEDQLANRMPALKRNPSSNMTFTVETFLPLGRASIDKRLAHKVPRDRAYMKGARPEEGVGSATLPRWAHSSRFVLDSGLNVEFVIGRKRAATARGTRHSATSSQDSVCAPFLVWAGHRRTKRLTDCRGFAGPGQPVLNPSLITTGGRLLCSDWSQRPLTLATTRNGIPSSS